MKSRRGNVILIISILGLLIMGAIFSLGYLTKTDVSTSSNMLRESLATNIAESVAAQIEAQVTIRPWGERFWLLEAQAAGAADGIPPFLAFDSSTPYVNLSKDTLPADQYDFTGVVKDLPGELRQYRLYLEVTVKGETYAFSWDKQWDQSLLTGMNRDSTQVDKPVDAGTGSTMPTDQLIDGIKKRVTDAPPPDNSGTSQTARLKALRSDEPGFASTTIAPDPKAPTLPPAPKGGK